MASAISFGLLARQDVIMSNRSIRKTLMDSIGLCQEAWQEPQDDLHKAAVGPVTIFGNWKTALLSLVQGVGHDPGFCISTTTTVYLGTWPHFFFRPPAAYILFPDPSWKIPPHPNHVPRIPMGITSLEILGRGEPHSSA